MATKLTMSASHLALAVLVAVIWGVNFIFVKLGLEVFSPLMLCALRFLLASIPAIFFIPFPAVPFRIVALYGFVMFDLQFSLLFIGMHVGMTPGMASLIMQVQVFFSMFFAAIFLGEMPSIWQISGALVAFFGIGIVATHFDNDVTLLGFLFILAAAATWGIGNLITKKMSNVNMIALVIWGSFIACIPMSIFALMIEGSASIVASYHNVTWVGLGALAYIVYVSTWVGYGVWNWLLSRYPVGMVVPFTLLVPFVGIVSSVIAFGEPFQLWKLVTGLLIIVGLCINLAGSRLFKIKKGMVKSVPL